MEYFSLIGDECFFFIKECESFFVYIFDVVFGEKKFSVFVLNGVLYVILNGRYFIIIDYVIEKFVKIYNVEIGVYVG